MAGVVVHLRKEPIEGQYGTGGILVTLECTQSDGLPLEIFLFRATPSRFQIEGHGTSPWGVYSGVCSIRDIWEYPVGAPEPQCIYAYSFLDFIRNCQAQVPGETLTVARLEEMAAERDGKPRYTWPYFRREVVELVVPSEEAIARFMSTAQEEIDILVESATTQETSLQDMDDWTFGSIGS
jgi:hypothetical protein